MADKIGPLGEKFPCSGQYVGGELLARVRCFAVALMKAGVTGRDEIEVRVLRRKWLKYPGATEAAKQRERGLGMENPNA